MNLKETVIAQVQDAIRKSDDKIVLIDEIMSTLTEQFPTHDPTEIEEHVIDVITRLGVAGFWKGKSNPTS